MKKRNLRSLLCIYAVAIAYAYTAMAQAAEPVANQAVKFTVPNQQIQTLGIKTAPLQSKTGAVKASFPAQVVIPSNAEQVTSSPVAGLVAQLLVQQNQAVRAGAPLIRIISPELGQLQLQLLQAATRAKLARQTSQREQQLFDEGIIPQRRIQEAEAGLSEAEASLSQAKAALRLSGFSSSTIERVIASGKPQDSITLTATRAGIVTEITAKAGQRVEAATALLHVAQTDTLWLDIQVPASESTHWQPGTRLKIQDRDMTAHILSSGTTVSADSQTMLLRAVIEGKTSQIRAGEFVTIELPMTTMQGSWDVPLAALAHDGNQAYLFVRTTDGFEAREVKIVANAGQRVSVQAVVKGSLKDGDQIAIAGVVALKGAWLNAKEGK